VTQQPEGGPHSCGVARPRLWGFRVPVVVPRLDRRRGMGNLNAPAEDYSLGDRDPNTVPRIGLVLDRCFMWEDVPEDQRTFPRARGRSMGLPQSPMRSMPAWR